MYRVVFYGYGVADVTFTDAASAAEHIRRDAARRQVTVSRYLICRNGAEWIGLDELER